MGFHSRAILSWVRWRWDLGHFQIFVVVVVAIFHGHKSQQLTKSAKIPYTCAILGEEKTRRAMEQAPYF